MSRVREKERAASTNVPSDRIGQDWKPWQKVEDPEKRAGAKWSRTLIRLLHLEEPLCGRLLASFVDLLVRMEDNGELPVPFADFLLRGRLWKVEDGTALGRQHCHCGARGGKKVFTRNILCRQQALAGARDGPRYLTSGTEETHSVLGVGV